MTENVRKVFDILGVEPNERFKLDVKTDERYCLFFIDENLNAFSAINDIAGGCDWVLKYCLMNTDKIIKLPKKKHVGDLICKDLKCENCPLYSINCDAGDAYSNLYRNLEYHYEQFKDKEIYDILKKRLDKEIDE